MLFRSPFQLPSRIIQICVGTLGLLVLLCLAYVESRYSSLQFASGPNPSHGDFIVFGETLLQSLQQNTPSVSALSRTGDAGQLVFWRATADSPRPDLVPMHYEDVGSMRSAHNAFLEQSRLLEVPYQFGTKGIISTAGGKYIPIFIVSLRMLRRTGCTLPVELLLQSRDEDPYLCNTLLPSLGGKCIFLSDYLGPKAIKIAEYQLKIFTILFSSFESVLFLDSDSFVVTDPTPLFNTSPFTTTGLITWPDFWASSASHNLYTILSLPTPPMTLRPSSESGQLLVSKRIHAHTLLMASYYNYHGPTHYFQLMTQGGPGQGDKETFLAAAEAIHAPFYQTTSVVDTVGYYEGTHYHGVAMLQYDPRYDDHGDGRKKRPFAMHHNIPKLDPVTLFDKYGGAISELTGEYQRLWGTREITLERFGRDLEREVWEELRVLACEYGDVLKDWKAVPTSAFGKKGTCALVEEYQEVVFS